MSTRVILEGVETVDHRLILPGATTWPRHPIPIIDGFGADSRIVGALVDVQREDDVVTAETALVLDWQAPPSWVPSADLVNVSSRSGFARMTITACELVAAHVLPFDDWAWR